MRELTGSPLAAFVAGLLFAFAPYRIPQSPHLQVLSAQWMPFALYGFRRYFASLQPHDGNAGTAVARLRPLAGAVAALVLQNLSCGYYVLYFSPFAVLYVAWELTERRLWHDSRVWRHLSFAAVAVLAATVPFLLPYALLREQLALSRSTAEVVRYSADVYSYLTAFSAQPVWGGVMNVFPKAEGDLFPGLTPLLLAAAGLAAAAAAAVRTAAGASEPRRGHRFAGALLAVAALHLAAAIAVTFLRRITLDLGVFTIRMTDASQLLLRASLLLVIALVASRRLRIAVTVFLQARGFVLLSLGAALWLSLGPLPQALGRRVDLAGPYALLYEYVPGFDGVRVPARFGMIAVLMLAVLAGYGAQLFDRRRLRPCLVVLALLFLAESLVLPFTVNGSSALRGYRSPEPRLQRPQRAPAVYHALARQDAATVVAELPLGVPDYDLRAMYYSIVHWRPLVNGYSGFFPPRYGQLTAALSDVPRHPQIAVEALRASGATVVLVHEAAYLDDQGAATSNALRQLGLVELFRDGQDVLLRLP